MCCERPNKKDLCELFVIVLFRYHHTLVYLKQILRLNLMLILH